MIQFSRDDSVVKVIVTPGFPLSDTTFVFSWNAGTEWAAKLLFWNISHKQATELQRIRQEAYEAGWKDAKAHRTKRTWFGSRWS